MKVGDSRGRTDDYETRTIGDAECRRCCRCGGVAEMVVAAEGIETVR